MNNFFWAIIPIAILIVGLGILKKPAHKVCLTTLIITTIIAVAIFDQPINNAFQAIVEGTVYAIWPIIIVIIAALFIYNLLEHSKYLEVIKNLLSSISDDQRIQVLILAWGFGGFLEAIAGYGTSVAIPIAILVTLGVDAKKSVIVCLIANTVAVAFGAVGIPVITLANITGLDVLALSHDISLQLAPFIIIVPFVLVMITGESIKAVKGVFWITLIAGVAFLIPEYYIASNVGPELAAVIGSLSSLICMIAYCKFTNRSKLNLKELNKKEALIAFSPYLIVTVLIIATSPLMPTIHDFFIQFSSSLNIYTGEGGKPLEMKWIVTPGVLMFIAAIFTIMIQKIKWIDAFNILKATLFKMAKSMLTIISIVSISKVMGYSGMVDVIAINIANITGNFYFIFATWIGGLGTFLTGSDTSSNVLFGSLQLSVAQSLNLDETWIVAANTTGAAIGKMISPQNIAIACVAAGMEGQEGKILSITFKYFVFFILATSFIIWIGL